MHLEILVKYVFTILDLSHAISAVRLLWNAILKMTNTKIKTVFLKLIYIYILCVFKNGMRKKISYIANRYSQAKNL